MADRMRIIVRGMVSEDIEQVSAIETTVFSDAWSMEGFYDSLKNENSILLSAVDEQERIVGYCCLYGVLDEGEIVNVAVHPKFRQQGIGEMLMKALIKAARSRGMNQFYLEVREGNHAAQQLYKKMGFAIVGVRKNFYEKPVENALVMFRDECQTLPL